MMDILLRLRDLFFQARENILIVRGVKVALVTLLMLGAFFVRIDTFWLPHLLGDQSHYLGLAMKMSEYSFPEGFNLRGIRQAIIPLDEAGEVQIGLFLPTEDPEELGDILGVLGMFGVTHYDQPLFHKPTGLPYMLMLSHRLFAAEGQPFSVVVSNLGPNAFRLRPRVLFEAQFYAVIVPLFFGLGAVLLTFFLGQHLFNFRVGFYSALMFAMHPVCILTDQRIFADSMVTFFVVLALLLFCLAREKGWDWSYLLAGASCGVAVLAKQTGGFFLIAVLAFTVLAHEHALWDFKRLPRIFINRAYVLTAIGVFLVTGFWFLAIYNTYGDPLFQPISQPGALAQDRSGWFALLRSRPPGWILYSVGIPWMGPPFVAMYFSLKQTAVETWKMICKKTFDYRFVLLWIVILTFGYMMRGGREHRRMTAVYPMMAIMASYCYDKFRTYSGPFSEYMGNRYVRETLVVVFFAASLVWMIYVGKTYTWIGGQLINVPF